MKRILLLIFLGIVLCSLNSIAGTVELSYTSVPASPSSTYYNSDFTVCGSEDKFLKIPYYYSSHSSCHANRYRVTFKLFRDGVLMASAGPITSSGTMTGWPGFTITFTPGVWTVEATLERKPCVGKWYTAETVGSNIIRVTDVCATPPCLPNVGISGTYTTPLTQASASIQSAGSTVIPAGATVRLDANNVSNNGYILLQPDFEAAAGSLFIAEALDGCGSAAPMRQAAKADPEDGAVLRVYPNPVTGMLTVQHPGDVGVMSVYGIDGKLWLSTPAGPGNQTVINLEPVPAGICFIRAEGLDPVKIVKQ